MKRNTIRLYMWLSKGIFEHRVVKCTWLLHFPLLLQYSFSRFAYCIFANVCFHNNVIVPHENVWASFVTEFSLSQSSTLFFFIWLYLWLWLLWIFQPCFKSLFNCFRFFCVLRDICALGIRNTWFKKCLIKWLSVFLFCQFWCIFSLALHAYFR